MRVVLDTNIFISGLVFAGIPGKVIEAALLGQYDLILSESILAEMERVLPLKFGWKTEHVQLAELDIRKSAEMVEHELTLTDCPDPDDNRILEAAVAGRAGCIVSGDRHLLGMKIFRGIEIVTAHEFLLRLDASPAEQR